MKKQTGLHLLFLSLFFSSFATAQPAVGPRKTTEKAVRLIPVPLNASPAELQSFLEKNRNVYFKPGTYNIGTLHISHWREGLIWGAGRLTTTLRGNIIFDDSRNVTIGNFNLINSGTAKGQSAIDVVGNSVNEIVFLNAL